MANDLLYLSLDILNGPDVFNRGKDLLQRLELNDQTKPVF